MLPEFYIEYLKTYLPSSELLTLQITHSRVSDKIRLSLTPQQKQQLLFNVIMQGDR